YLTLAPAPEERRMAGEEAEERHMDLQDEALGGAPEVGPNWRQRRLLGLGGPPALALFGAGLVGPLGLLFLHQVAGVTAADAALQRLQTEQTRLERQDALLHERLGTLTSPAYIERRARELGLRPGPVGGADVITNQGGSR